MSRKEQRQKKWPGICQDVEAEDVGGNKKRTNLALKEPRWARIREQNA